MNERSTASYGALPLFGLKRIEEACDRFEAALRSGSEPKPEDYLSPNASEEERDRLLLELKALADTYAKSPDERSTRQIMESSEPAPPVQQESVSGSNLPAKIGRYSIMARLERGGMGVVYKAWHPVLDQPVALKTILPKYVRSSAVKNRLLDEARKVVKLKHPHIVSVFDADEEAGMPFFTMALIEGGSLARRLAEFQLGTPIVNGQGEPVGLSTQGWTRKQIQQRKEKLLGMMEKVCRAVHAAHAMNPPVIHRDLKPGNILMEGDEPRVSDFGLAVVQVGQDGDPDLHDYSGTPPYMAPEQHRGVLVEIGPATDIWAIGVILYELCTGRLPFQGMTRDELKAKIQFSDAPPANERNKGVDLNLAAVIQKCLKKNPKERYSTVGLLLDELARCRRAEAVQARRETWRERGCRLVRMHGLTGLVGGAVVLLLGVISYLSSPSENPPRAELPRHLVPANHQALTARIQQQLAAGKVVRLEEDSGRPLVLGSTDFGTPCSARSSRGTLRVQQLEGYSVLRMFSDPVCKEYEISAELRQDDSMEGGLIGLGVLAWQRTTVFGEEIALLALMFGDRGRLVEPAMDGSACGLVDLQLHRRIGKVSFSASLVGPTDRRIKQTADGWRRVKVQVSPGTISFEVDGAWKQVLQQGQIASQAREQLFFQVDPHVVPPGSKFANELAAFNVGIRVFQFREALSLYVVRSTASIRNLTITPGAE